MKYPSWSWTQMFFLVSLAPQSEYAPIFDTLIEGHYHFVVSTEILEEYEEVIGERYDEEEQ